jgi:tight adherence protein C
MEDALLTLSLTSATAGLLVLGGIALRAVLMRRRSVRKLDTALSNMRAGAAQAASPAQAVPAAQSAAR